MRRLISVTFVAVAALWMMAAPVLADGPVANSIRYDVAATLSGPNAGAVSADVMIPTTPYATATPTQLTYFYAYGPGFLYYGSLTLLELTVAPSGHQATLRMHGDLLNEITQTTHTISVNLTFTGGGRDQRYSVAYGNAGCPTESGATAVCHIRQLFQGATVSGLVTDGDAMSFTSADSAEMIWTTYGEVAAPGVGV